MIPDAFATRYTTYDITSQHQSSCYDVRSDGTRSDRISFLTGVSREYWFLRRDTLTRRRANTMCSVVDYKTNVRRTVSSSIELFASSYKDSQYRLSTQRSILRRQDSHAYCKTYPVQSYYLIHVHYARHVK